MPPTSPNIQPRSILEIVLRHKKRIVLWPLFCLVFGALFFVFSPRTYRSEARLFLRVGRESVGIDPAASAGQTMQLYTADRKDEVKSAEGIFKSRSVAAQVVDRLGPDVVLGRGGDGPQTRNVVADAIHKPIDLLIGMIKSLDPISEREEAIIKVERNLSVAGERQATVIVVQYKAATPQLAQTVCHAVVDVAQQEHMRVHRSEGSTPFFTEQQQRLRQQLDQSLEALRDAKNELGLANVEQRRATLEAQFNAIELDRLSSQQQLATSQARIEDLQRQLAEVSERLVASKRSVPNQGADILRDRLYELQMKSMDLQARYNESHPLVIAVNDQLKEAQKVLAEQAEQRTETTDEVNPIHRDLSMTLKREASVVAGLKARLVELAAQKKAVLADVRTVNQQDLKIDQLTRDAELARTKYMQYAQTMEEARMDKELQNELISNISVAQEATLAEKPISPSRMITAAGTMLFAIGGTFALVLLGEQGNVSAPSYVNYPVERRQPRRRARRENASKSNGQSAADELCAPPK